MSFSQKAILVVGLLIAFGAVGFAGWRSAPTEEGPEAIVSVEEGHSYSLLIDDERFLIRAKPGQKVQIRILAETSPAALSNLPPRVRLPYDTAQADAARLRRSRFRFRYDAPSALRDFRREERLDEMRKDDDLQTALGVMHWARAQFEPKSPEWYPPQNARDLLREIRNGDAKGFCAQYCYLTVQALQALGFAARHVTIDAHEICEVWLPDRDRWVALDPLNESYFTDVIGAPMSALDIHRNPMTAILHSARPISDTSTMARRYHRLGYWLRNDLYTKPVHLFDLRLYVVHLVTPNEPPPAEIAFPLMTMWPEELYEPPLPIVRSLSEV